MMRAVRYAGTNNRRGYAVRHIGAQERWAEKTARALGLALVGKADDYATPASVTGPGMLCLLDLCERENATGRPIECLLVRSLDRLGRRATNLAAIAARL